MPDEILADYRAAREGVGFVDLNPKRGKIRATGPDRVSFLHSMVSNDVQRLEERHGRYNTFLTAQGKMVADLFLYKFPDCLLLDLDSSILQKTINTLEKYLVMDEVELSNASDAYGHYYLMGPDSADLVVAVCGDPPPDNRLEMAEAGLQGRPFWIIGKTDPVVEGFEVLLDADLKELFCRTVWEAGREYDLRSIGPQAQEILRIEAGRPLYGQDLDEGRYPMEARLGEALSFDKGCYIGQEVVAKATNIGGVARLLVLLRLEGDRVPKVGSLLIDPEGKRVGSITSACLSPALECPIAIGFVKKSRAEAGQELLAVGPQVDEGKPIPGRVVEKFVG